MSVKKVKVSITPSDLNSEIENLEQKKEILENVIDDIIKDNLEVFRDGETPSYKIDTIKGKSKRNIYHLAFEAVENNLGSVLDLVAEENIDSYSDFEIAEIIKNEIDIDEIIQSYEKEDKLRFLVEDVLNDDSWNNDGETRDFSDTIRRIENGTVAGIFYLDDKIIKNLIEKINKFEKKIRKLSEKIEMSQEAKNELEALQSVISKAENGDIEFHTHTMKKLLSFKSKYIDEDKNKLEETIEEKSSKLQEKLEKRDALKTSYDRISVYGYGEEGGELVDYVIKDGDTNQFGQRVYSNSGIADTLESLGEIEENKNFKELTKNYQSSFDKVIAKQNKIKKSKNKSQ